jgi:surfactin synthase thioesterase subunit
MVGGGLMNIKAKLVGKVTSLVIDGQHFYLTEDDVKRLRSEMNRCLQRIYDKKNQGKGQNV